MLEDQYPAANGWEDYLAALETATPPIGALGVTDYSLPGNDKVMKAGELIIRSRGK